MTGLPLRKIADRYSESAIDDEVVLMRLDNGDFFSLTGSSRSIWDLIDGRRDRSEIVAELAETYAVASAAIAEDVGDFVSALVEAGLIAEG